MRLPLRTSLVAVVVGVALGGCAAEDVDGLDHDPESVDQLGRAVAVAPWSVRDGLHLADPRFGAVAIGGRDAWPMWVSGSNVRPVLLRFRVQGAEGAPVRVAVLGPLVDGSRATLASAGYASPVNVASVDVAVKTTGQLLIVVGSHGLATEAAYDLVGTCRPGATEDQCNPWRVDALSRPKVGGLVGRTLADGQQLVSARLNGGLAPLDKYEVELWRSPPAFHYLATRIGVSESSGSEVNFIFPSATIREGDDLLMVVRRGTRLPYADHGVWSRYAPRSRAFARLDAIDYADLGGLIIQGVASYFEGRDLFVLRRASDKVEIDRESAVASLPGQATNGLGSFAIGIGEPFDDRGDLKPNLPSDGEILQLVRVNLDESVQSLGCFEYCNDLEGTGDCTARKVACP